jgi:predicted amidohydrolase
MAKMMLTLCQFAPFWQQPEKSCELLSQQLSKVSSSDLFILPEMFATGFSMQPEQFVDAYDVEPYLQELADQRQQDIIAGVAERSRNGFVNNALVINRDGKVLARYTKQRCFSHAGEDKVYQAGNQLKIVEIAGVKIALFICYDLRFPELFREVAQQVEMMVVIANWPQSRQAHWQTLLTARAIENQGFVVGVNRSGTDGNGLQYVGGSMVVNPNGEILLQMNDELFAEVEIDSDLVIQQRRKFAFLQDA